MDFYFKFCLFALLLFSRRILCSFILPEKPQNWTYFVFAQQWPPAACLEVPHGKCLIPKGTDGWSIHGLWPTSDVGYPSFCNSSWPFNPDTLKSILPSLEAKWPNIYKGTSEYSFWKHEWVKHGTCAASLREFNTEFKYFRRSLLLHDTLNIYHILKSAGINPSAESPFSLTMIQNAITLEVGMAPKLFCKNHKDYDFPILTSLYLCLSKDLDTIDCDKIHVKTCANAHVMYLPLNDTITDIYDF